MLTLDAASVAHLMGDADTRWINRGAHDLMGVAPDAKESTSGIPRGRALYGTLPEQLADPESFLSRLRGILAARARHGIAEATLLEVADVDHRAILAMVMRLPDGGAAATILNFSTVPLVEAVLRTEHAVPGTEILDLGTDEPLGEVDEEHGVHVVLGAHDGRVLRIG